MATEPVATVVIPTHDHASVLDLSVRSALEQTVQGVEVMVVGDGVDDDTRDVMAELCREDRRVQFLDLPKGPHHGEVHRDRAVKEASADVVCYLCDDDLLLPEHVADMVSLLHRADLAQCMNGYIGEDTRWHAILGDLAEPACRAWVLKPDRNFVSLTGTAHTKAAYERLPHGWRTTPSGRWPDHYMWQQFLSQDWVRAVTGTRVTVLQLPSHLANRDGWEPGRRRAELSSWRALLTTPAGRARFDDETRGELMRAACVHHLLREALTERVVATERVLSILKGEIVAVRAAHAANLVTTRAAVKGALALATAARAETRVEAEHRRHAEEEREAAETTLQAVQSTRAWRWRSALLRVPPVRLAARLTIGHRTEH
jgi:Glycosyl transferase family 2